MPVSYHPELVLAKLKGALVIYADAVLAGKSHAYYSIPYMAEGKRDFQIDTLLNTWNF